MGKEHTIEGHFSFWVEHPNYGALLVLGDERKLFMRDRGYLKYLITELTKTYSLLSNEDLEDISKMRLLSSDPNMYPQVYGDKPPKGNIKIIP